MRVLSEKDIDPVRTTSNDICEIFTVRNLESNANSWLHNLINTIYFKGRNFCGKKLSRIEEKVYFRVKITFAIEQKIFFSIFVIFLTLV